MLFGILNCTKQVDFDQIDDAEIKPNYILTLVYTDLFTPDFLNEIGEEILIKTDVIQGSLSSFSIEYIEKIELSVASENTFDREFNVKIVLYDASQTPIYNLPEINVPANSGELFTIIEIPKEDIGLIFNTHYFGFYIRMLPSNDGSLITYDDDFKLSLKSSMELFLKYKK